MYIPKSNWCSKLFQDWMAERNNVADMKVPVKLIDDPDVSFETLDYWLSIFVLEVRKGDESYYCGWSLHSIIAGIGRHLRDVQQSNDS